MHSSFQTRCYALAAFATIALSGPAPAQQLRDVTMGLAGSGMAAGLPILAKEMGLFEKQGLNVKFVTLENGAGASTAMLSGSVNVAVSGPVELVAAQTRGQKAVVIASLLDGVSGTLVLSKAVADKLGVSPTAPFADRLKALSGLIIAAPGANSTATVTLRGSAKAAGVDIRYTYIGQAGMIAALESGAVQGYVASAPVWATSVIRKNGVAWISGPGGEYPPQFTPVSNINLQTMREYADANPAVIKGLQAAVAEFGKALEERPNDVKAAIAKSYPDLDREALEMIFAADSKAWKTKPLTAESIVKEIAFIKASGIELPNIDRLDPASLVVQ